MCKIGIIIYSILQFIAFVFILVGTPIDMFRDKSINRIGDTQCVTMWGLKTKCYSTKYDTRPKDMFTSCKGRLDRFRAAEAFAIINIAFYGLGCLFGFIMLCCCLCFRWLCLILNILGITSCVSWAIMVYAHSTTSDKVNLPSKANYCLKLKDYYNYGAGFALVVVAWCLDIIAIIFLMLPC